MKTVRKKNNKTGETVTVTITYDEKGRPITTSVEKEKIGLDGKLDKVDGKKHTFKYTDEGNVVDQREDGYGNVEIMTYYPPITVGPDGKRIKIKSSNI